MGDRDGGRGRIRAQTGKHAVMPEAPQHTGHVPWAPAASASFGHYDRQPDRLGTLTSTEDGKETGLALQAKNKKTLFGGS